MNRIVPTCLVLLCAVSAADAAQAVVRLGTVALPHRPSVAAVRSPAKATRHRPRHDIPDAPRDGVTTERWTAGEWREAPPSSPGTEWIETRPRAHQTWQDQPEDIGPD